MRSLRDDRSLGYDGTVEMERIDSFNIPIRGSTGQDWKWGMWLW